MDKFAPISFFEWLSASMLQLHDLYWLLLIFLCKLSSLHWLVMKFLYAFFVQFIYLLGANQKEHLHDRWYLKKVSDQTFLSGYNIFRRLIQHSQAGYDPPFAEGTEFTEWKFDAFTNQATTVGFTIVCWDNIYTRSSSISSFRRTLSTNQTGTTNFRRASGSCLTFPLHI